MCQTATQRTLVRWTRCTMTTQNFKTLLFPLTLVLHLQITRLLAALTAASRVSVLQGSAVASAHQGRSGYLFGSCRLMISRISHLCQSHFQIALCRGALANLLTLSLTTLSVFLAARTMFGPIAGPGGTVFALLVLILFALIGNTCTN